MDGFEQRNHFVWEINIVSRHEKNRLIFETLFAARARSCPRKLIYNENTIFRFRKSWKKWNKPPRIVVKPVRSSLRSEFKNVFVARRFDRCCPSRKCVPPTISATRRYVELPRPVRRRSKPICRQRLLVLDKQLTALRTVIFKFTPNRTVRIHKRTRTTNFTKKKKNPMV